MQYGYFDDQNREYVITRPDTPLPWINYLGCQAYFGRISNTAGGYSFYRDARLRRITRYRYNNAPFIPISAVGLHPTATPAFAASRATATTALPSILADDTFIFATIPLANSGLPPGNPRGTNWSNIPAATAWATPRSARNTATLKRAPATSCPSTRISKSGN